MTRRRNRPRPPDRPIRLLSLVVAGDQQAWHQFVEAYSGFLHSLAWRYARGDVDLAGELFVVALEGLVRPDAAGRPFYRLRRYLESLERFGRRSRFVTWLALVAKNLFRDWFRAQDGRRWLPKEIEDLGRRGQALFQALLLDGLSEGEAFSRLRSRWPGLTEAAYDGLLEQVYSALGRRNLWPLYHDLLRRLPALPVDETGGACDGLAVQLADRNPLHRPDGLLEAKQQLALAERLVDALGEALQALPPTQRRVVQLCSLQGMSGEQARRALGYRKRQRVYDELASARHRLRSELERAGIGAADVREALGWLDLVSGARSIRTRSRSAADVRPDVGDSDPATAEEV